jgi:hypothetical protein
MDHWLIGTFVLLIHDFTDLTLIFARAYKVSCFLILGLQALLQDHSAEFLCYSIFNLGLLPNFYLFVRFYLQSVLRNF